MVGGHAMVNIVMLVKGLSHDNLPPVDNGLRFVERSTNSGHSGTDVVPQQAFEKELRIGQLNESWHHVRVDTNKATERFFGSTGIANSQRSHLCQTLC